MSARWSQDQLRTFALSLPEAHLGARWGQPDVRVRNKIFVTLPSDGSTVNVKTTPLALDMLVRSDAETYRDVWNGWWVGVDLAHADAAELRELLLEGYCLVAPKPLASLVRANPPQA